MTPSNDAPIIDNCETVATHCETVTRQGLTRWQVDPPGAVAHGGAPQP